MCGRSCFDHLCCCCSQGPCLAGAILRPPPRLGRPPRAVTAMTAPAVTTCGTSRYGAPALWHCFVCTIRTAVYVTMQSAQVPGGVSDEQLWLSVIEYGFATQGKHVPWEDAQGKIGEAHQAARISEINACKATKELEAISTMQQESETAKTRLAEVKLFSRSVIFFVRRHGPITGLAVHSNPGAPFATIVVHSMYHNRKDDLVWKNSLFFACAAGARACRHAQQRRGPAHEAG